VIIHAYNQETKLIEAPVSIHYLSQYSLQKLSTQTLLPAFNNLPGIRMEERSPGSYRLNIRGSSLRSPFGVRNVKTYYNNIPYTEPGGMWDRACPGPPVSISGVRARRTSRPA
jgi:iron complex outermembrane receptor protein